MCCFGRVYRNWLHLGYAAVRLDKLPVARSRSAAQFLACDVRGRSKFLIHSSCLCAEQHQRLLVPPSVLPLQQVQQGQLQLALLRALMGRGTRLRRRRQLERLPGERCR